MQTEYGIKSFRTSLAFVSGGVYVLGLMLDLAITYSVFRARPEFFAATEANRAMVGYLSGNGGLPLVFMSIPIVMLSALAISYRMASRKGTKSYDSLLLVVCIVAAIVGGIHVFGGMSWLKT